MSAEKQSSSSLRNSSGQGLLVGFFVRRNNSENTCNEKKTVEVTPKEKVSFWMSENLLKDLIEKE